MNNCDVTIIGAGPAGLTAGIYCARYGLKTKIIEKGLIGGTATLASTIQNWPGEQNISGMDLMNKFREHTEKSGAEIISNTVLEIKSDAKEKEIIMSGETIKCKAVIIAVGSKSKWLKVKGEKEFLNKGIHFCATCDGPMYNEKEVVVVGCDNRALEEALYLSKITSKTTLLCQQKELTAEKSKQELIKNNKNLEVMKEVSVLEFTGKDFLEEVIIRKSDGTKETINASGAFIYIGTEPNTDFVSVKKDSLGRIIADSEMKTSENGIFAAGDCINKKLLQIVTSAGEGATAAHSVVQYIQTKK